MKQILPGLYTFTGLIAGRVYCIEDADGLTLIDASIGSAADKILAQLNAAGHQPQAVKRILITHGHPDHVGAAPKLQQVTGAEVFASAIDKPAIQGEADIARRPNFPRPPKTYLKPTRVDYALEDGDIISAFGSLVAVATPGHSPGHMAFWQPDKKVLFCGDVLFNAPWLMLPPGFLTVDMEQDKQSVRRIAELNPNVVCFGHGNPLTENTAQTLHQFVTKL